MSRVARAARMFNAAKLGGFALEELQLDKLYTSQLLQVSRRVEVRQRPDNASRAG